MVSVTTIIRSGFYVARLLPLLWIPLATRLRLRRATSAFENELLNSGLEPAAAHQLANTFNKTYMNLIKQATSPRNWTQIWKAESSQNVPEKSNESALGKHA